MLASISGNKAASSYLSKTCLASSSDRIAQQIKPRSLPENTGKDMSEDHALLRVDVVCEVQTLLEAA